MGFLDEAKREKKEEIRQRKAMQAARKRIYSRHNGMVRKLLGQLGEETWGTRLLGKCHVDKVEKGKEFGLDAGPWGWYVGKGRRGKSSVPYGLGTSAPGKAEVYGVLISLHSEDLSQSRFAVMYGEFGRMRTRFTPDLSQAALQEALAEAFRSGPLDLDIFEQGVNAALTLGMLAAETEETVEQLEKSAEDWAGSWKEGLAASSVKGTAMATCPACGSEVQDGVPSCPSCGASLGRDEAVPTDISQLPSQPPAQPVPQRIPLAARTKTDSNKLILVAAVAILIILTICCVCPFTLAVTDSVLRGLGILPTYTPTVTEAPTLTPTITHTPKLTDTPKPTETSIPTATLTPTPQPIGVATVKGDTVNVRAGPGTNYDVVTKVSKGDKLSVYARNDDGGWLQVSVDAGQWIAADLVELDVNMEQVPVARNVPPTPTGTSRPTAAPLPPADTPTPPQGIPGVIQLLSEFEESQFCRTYNCRFDDSWSLRSGGINNVYDIDVSPEVGVEITSLNGRPVDFGLTFYDRQRLDSDDLQLIYSFLNSIHPGVEVDPSIKNFIERNVEVDVFQICQANSIPFGSMRIWAGKVMQQIISVGESCP
jgi:rubrerythrin